VDGCFVWLAAERFGTPILYILRAWGAAAAPYDVGGAIFDQPVVTAIVHK